MGEGWSALEFVKVWRAVRARFWLVALSIFVADILTAGMWVTNESSVGVCGSIHSGERLSQ